jgi:hypothetical protein
MTDYDPDFPGIGRRQRIWHAIAIAILVLAMSFMGLLLFWLLAPYEVSEVQVPIKILNENKEIPVNDNIIMELEVNKPNDRPVATASRSIVCDDGNLITLAPSVNNLPVGEYTIVNDTFVLPPKTRPGAKCSFVFVNTYKVNPIREITKTWTSEEFLVLRERHS